VDELIELLGSQLEAHTTGAATGLAEMGTERAIAKLAAISDRVKLAEVP